MKEKVNVALTIGTEGDDEWQSFMYGSFGPTRKPVIARIPVSEDEDVYVLCDSPSEPIDLTRQERIFANLPEAVFHADLLAGCETWQTMMDEEKPKRAVVHDKACYRVWEDNHGDVSYWSSEELAKAECLAIANSMYDGDESVIGELVGYEPIVTDGWSFAYGNAYGGRPEFEELMR